MQWSRIRKGNLAFTNKEFRGAVKGIFEDLLHTKQEQLARSVLESMRSEPGDWWESLSTEDRVGMLKQIFPADRFNETVMFKIKKGVLGRLSKRYRDGIYAYFKALDREGVIESRLRRHRSAFLTAFLGRVAEQRTEFSPESGMVNIDLLDPFVLLDKSIRYLDKFAHWGMKRAIEGARITVGAILDELPGGKMVKRAGTYIGKHMAPLSNMPGLTLDEITKARELLFSDALPKFKAGQISDPLVKAFKTKKPGKLFSVPSEEALEAARFYSDAIKLGDVEEISKWGKRLSKEQKDVVRWVMNKSRELSRELYDLGEENGGISKAVYDEYNNGIISRLYDNTGNEYTMFVGHNIPKIKELRLLKDRPYLVLRGDIRAARFFVDSPDDVVYIGSRGGYVAIKFKTVTARDAYVKAMQRTRASLRSRENKANLRGRIFVGKNDKGKPIHRSVPKVVQKGLPLTAEERAAMGEIFRFDLATHEHFANVETTLARAKIYKAISEDPSITASESLSAEEAEAAGYTKMINPKDFGYGALRGRFVKPSLFETLESHKTEFGEMLASWNEIKDITKITWVTMEPRAHARQLWGNALISQLAGCSVFNPRNWKYYVTAAKAMYKKTALWAEAVKRGITRSDFAHAEVEMFAKSTLKGATSFRKFLHQIKTNPVFKVGGKIYGFPDSWFKMAKWLKHLDEGMTYDQAAQEVSLFLPNYREVGTWFQKLSRFPAGGAFVRFRAEEIKAILNGAARNPVRTALYFLTPFFSQKAGQHLYGYTDEQMEAFKQKYGDYFMLTPFSPNPISPTYFMWGSSILDLLGFGRKPLPGDTPGPLSKVAEFVKPMFDSIETAAYRAIWDKEDSWGREVGEQWTPEDEKTLTGISKFLGNSWVPGGRSYELVKRLMTTGVDKWGKKLSTPAVLADVVLGLVMEEYDPTIEVQKIAIFTKGKIAKAKKDFFRKVSSNAPKEDVDRAKTELIAYIKSAWDEFKKQKSTIVNGFPVEYVVGTMRREGEQEVIATIKEALSRMSPKRLARELKSQRSRLPAKYRSDSSIGYLIRKAKSTTTTQGE